jgi:hypothetical protein
VKRLESVAGLVENHCTRGRLLLKTLSHAQAADRERVLHATMNVAARAASGGDYGGCLRVVDADLVRYLPRSEQHAAADRILDAIETNQHGWVFTADIVRSIAEVLEPHQVARLERYAAAQPRCCPSVIVRSTLAKHRRFSAVEALDTAAACREMCGNDDDVLPVLALVDARARAAFLAPELDKLGRDSDSWTGAELHSLRRIAPYLEKELRHELMKRAFRRMPVLGLEERDDAGWGELPPHAHYGFILNVLAPFVSSDLVPSALYSVPREWSPEIRSIVVASFAAALAPEVRRSALPTILDALPDAADDLHYARARLLVAADLPEREVRRLLDRLLELEASPSERAEVLGSLLGSARGEYRLELERTFLREVDRIETADGRGRVLAGALDQWP